MRKLVKTKTTEIVPLSKKQERREHRREGKALVAAQLETTIEKELLDRLKKVKIRFLGMKILEIFQGNYGEIYNFNQKAFESNMEEMDSEDDEDDEDEDSDGESGEREYVEDDSDIESENEIEDMEGYEKVQDQFIIRVIHAPYNLLTPF